MSHARSTILSHVQTSLGRDNGTLPQSIRNALEERLSSPPTAVRPAMPEKDLTQRFITKLETVAGTVVRVPDLTAVPPAIVRHLDQHGLPYQLVATRDPTIENIPWLEIAPKEVTLHHGAATRTDRVSLTSAFAAIAETGTLVLVSGNRTPTTLNFLPEDHIVILLEDQILPYMEDAWKKIRAAFTSPPRTINFITGPSRTGDIEQTMQLGVHGPRHLTVILVAHRIP
uniref:L-lactate dehydrogenase complex protein LldG n=1 Tax=Candidatus Kentrum sp. TUN TaxID=2126343 RepID=A0A450ZM24_9GAMM|nr:MAG: L-lactate dehydrogenase complex protein LldG [Candidatus Kentron sp. TUN]VFK54449.1 MAG: L-lactate dehydrogenase complex protein LldG [Candidatus Kentron sp. TUN]VFK54834.1 MAG: L-lactate dehydrogenase complex protein LldG [Candidatus Kentron sp. TUN]